MCASFANHIDIPGEIEWITMYVAKELELIYGCYTAGIAEEFGPVKLLRSDV